MITTSMIEDGLSQVSSGSIVFSPPEGTFVPRNSEPKVSPTNKVTGEANMSTAHNKTPCYES